MGYSEIDPYAVLYYEPVAWARAVTAWFWRLTIMVEWLKAGRLAPLWDLVGKRGRPMDGNDLLVFLDTTHPTQTPLRFAFPYFIADLGIEVSEHSFVAPRTDDELRECAWRAAGESVISALGCIDLTVTSKVFDRSVPRILWGLRAYGALEAAFLQWYFREFAITDLAWCEAPGCQNPIFPPRKHYCSERCRQRAIKRRYRERKEAAING